MIHFLNTNIPDNKNIEISLTYIYGIGRNESISSKSLAYKIKKIIKFKYKIVFDKSYPDGTMNKNLDSRKIKKTNWKPKTKLNTGLASN